jgi:hypothetical protein
MCGKPRSRTGWSSAALWQRRHENVRLPLRGRSELRRQRIEIARDDCALGLGEHGRKLVSMRLEVLGERCVEDLLRRPPLELCKQAERRVVALEDPNRLCPNSQGNRVTKLLSARK